MADQNSQFYAILTNVGSAKQANADALGIAWKITQLGVGDANGTEPSPNATQTALISEWRRAPLNQLKVDDTNSSIIVAEQIIPADVGGKWIREIGLYDADGDLVAVANCPPTYKPLLSQGSGRTQVVRMNLIVSSSSNVELKIDPSVVLATREWVTSELAKQDFKHSVVAATTASITLSGLQTIDGIAVAAGARVLVKNQSAAKDNGLYLVTASGPWTRCTDADTSAKVTSGMLVLVERGTVNADSAWQLVTDGAISVGVSPWSFEMAFGRTGVTAGTYRSVTVDAYGRVVAAANPTTVAGYGLTDVYTKTQIDQALALKAALASPALTGVPTAPTPAAGTNTAQLATAAFVQAAIAALVASSPGALDTLNELAAALGNDPNFAASVTNALALKAPLASPTFTGDPKAPTPLVTDNDTSVATTAFVRSVLARYGLATSTAYVWNGNIDLILETGLYTVSNGATGTRPKSPGTTNDVVAGEILHLERDGTNCAVQIWESLTGGLDAPAGGKSGITFKRSRVSGGEWTAWGQIWDSVNTPKQSNPLDVTPGAMLTPGAFGWGASAVNFTGDIDAIAVSGLYMVSAATTGIKPEYPALVGVGQIPNGTLEHIERGSSKMATQRWDSLIGSINPLSFVRTKNTAGVWSAWELVVTDRHLPYRAKAYYRSAGVYQWTVPAGVYKVAVEVVGGGGSGAFGADGSTSSGPGGGGGGGISHRLCTVVPGSVITVTVGAGGAGVSGEADAGIAGGASSFGSFCSATGGRGGIMNGGVVGGAGSGGDFNASLGMGFPPVRNSMGTANWGGPGGGGESAFAALDTSTLTRPGMGGGGRTKTRSQAGADGCVFITY